MAPSRAGRWGVPSRWVATVRLPTSKGPSATPAHQVSPLRGGTGAPNSSVRRRSRLQSGSAARVVTSGPCTPPAWPRAWRAQSREVTSEKPSSQPSAAGRGCSKRRAAPQPPRTQASSGACCRSARRCRSWPARYPQRRAGSKGISTVRPQLCSTATPCWRRPTSARAELAATSRTRSPCRRAGGRPATLTPASPPPGPTRTPRPAAPGG